ncbi:DNA gyrase inhibitor YacG [Amphritea japonica]|uniref:DNA gyrase inhibitor YacG n=1 Tax=Amphritea japonica ATCC BAA-1530 TaxID=1278309 RepID=A0A7R6P223_9GAMM|nr:DNA gyrase inhibitor YacG [Amphritea japonica]BBB25519.1 DNA gyrase inhibitor [Amphritea japonica ATCC BAA-1530]
MANPTQTKKPLVACPSCSKQLEWNTANTFRPFCSERCKLIDLGAWASEEYKVAAEPSVDDYSSSFDDPESQEYQDRPLH